jgi:dienelactone hydrolase
MTDDIGDLDDGAALTTATDFRDEELEAAARLDGARAMTVGYCATGSTAWYCLPF